MTNSERFVQAHKNTREAVSENSELNYRVQFGLELSLLYSDEMDIEKMSIEELEELQQKVIKKLAELKASNKETFEFNFEFTQCDSRKGTPYAAKLVINDEGKIDREFFELDKEYGKKSVSVSGTYKAKVGDIIEQREGGSWKNDYRYWYLVTEDGKLEKVADIDNSNRKSLVKKYLKNEIEAKDLLGSW